MQRQRTICGYINPPVWLRHNSTLSSKSCVSEVRKEKLHGKEKLNAFTKIWIIISKCPKHCTHTFCTHSLSLSLECRTQCLSEFHTCAKLHSHASFGKTWVAGASSKSSTRKPSRIHGPYFINITLHVCILIKFSTFFSCTFLLFGFLSSLRFMAFVSCKWNINSIIFLAFSIYYALLK